MIRRPVFASGHGEWRSVGCEGRVRAILRAASDVVAQGHAQPIPIFQQLKGARNMGQFSAENPWRPGQLSVEINSLSN
jgi:hypothetical protein